jgi:hypothetical protein
MGSAVNYKLDKRWWWQKTMDWSEGRMMAQFIVSLGNEIDKPAGYDATGCHAMHSGPEYFRQCKSEYGEEQDLL